jgi:hypothetical protein
VCSIGVRGAASPKWVGDSIGEEGLHKRIVVERGKAKAHLCIDCGEQAFDWSHVHDTDPLDVSNYEPRCRKDHAAYDGTAKTIGNIHREAAAAMTPEQRREKFTPHKYRRDT